MEVHRCRFVDYTPAAINALTFAPKSTKPLLACARAGGDIEIWNPKNWHLEKIIPGGASYNIEALTWAHQIVLGDDDYDTPEEKAEAQKKLLSESPRLFSAGLNSLITEWDLTTLCPKQTIDSHGGAVWCLAANNSGTKLAVGCEDGCIRIFNIIDGDLSFERSFVKQKARILSLAWSPDDKVIVTGSADSSIRKWDVKLGRPTSRMTVERFGREDTLVWAVKILKNGCIVSGDSLGHVKFWDGEMGTMIQSFNAHSADILCVVANEEGNTVFTSGVDRKVIQFRLVENANYTPVSRKKKDSSSAEAPKSEMKWILAGTRRYHSHDVKALALDESRPVNALVSGGVDVQLVVCPAAEFPNMNQWRLPYFPQKPLISMSKAKRLLMCRFPNSIRVWKLGKAAPPMQPYGNLEIGTDLGLIENLESLLEIKLKDENHIIASAISEDGQWIAVSDIYNIKLFRLTENPSNPSVVKIQKIKSFPSEAVTSRLNPYKGAHHILFTPDSSKLVIATTDSYIKIIDLSEWENGSFEILRTFGQHHGDGMMTDDEAQNDDDRVGTISSLSVSADGQWLASGDLFNRIFVYNLDALQYHCTLPKFSSVHTGLYFHSYSPTLVVPLSSNEFYLYDIEAKRLTDWSRQYSQNLPTRFMQLKEKIMGVSFNPARKNTIMLWGANYMCMVDITKPVEKDTIINIAKRKRIEITKEQSKISKEIRKKITESNFNPKVISALTLEANQPMGQKMMQFDQNFQALFKYQPLMFLDFTGPDSLCVVERPWFAILEKLPPSFYKAKYGT
ncbi:WD40 repeat-like protein [Basidiobolus meristosporus CBS 931.73]|uniref:WD40 repeat-like protein n=1 Tax=Basidiobolus meristosporus CBS 931.73 TaxID=1314790 RepID=A0A1Y1VRW1_9FUNG|nr:WD40 repeat-like protein [Basidiobolus meristosporus CBS 931.73]|eukprot:ORX63923.1 WD40 repeat-like protein [Basidiobolus meristosporus CBS 931.73]